MNSNEVERAAEEIRISGFSVLPDVLTQDEIDAARERLEVVYRKQVEEIGGESRLLQASDAYTARWPLVYEEIFLAVALKPRVLDVIRLFLGNYFTIIVQAGLLNPPRPPTEVCRWHRDIGSYRFVCSPPLAVTALITLDPFTGENGATQMVAGSHKHEAFPSDHYVERHAVAVEAPAGAAIVFDSMMYHRAGVNRSKGLRRAVNNVYSIPALRQGINLPRMLSGKYADSLFLRRFLGYDAEGYDDVTHYREELIRRASKQSAKSP
jgi:ectoine hydroxylase-related dioxygenase (phytanoyl-CoA dioxygenase family)